MIQATGGSKVRASAVSYLVCWRAERKSLLSHKVSWELSNPELVQVLCADQECHKRAISSCLCCSGRWSGSRKQLRRREEATSSLHTSPVKGGRAGLGRQGVGEDGRNAEQQGEAEGGRQGLWADQPGEGDGDRTWNLC